MCSCRDIQRPHATALSSPAQDLDAPDIVEGRRIVLGSLLSLLQKELHLHALMGSAQLHAEAVCSIMLLGLIPSSACAKHATAARQVQH